MTTSALVLNDSQFYPRWANTGGSAMRRTQDLENNTLTADWQPTGNLV